MREKGAELTRTQEYLKEVTLQSILEIFFLITL